VSVVKINAITVEPERAEELVARFAARAGAVGGSEGFEAFELLRPNDDRNQFLVYTRWRSEEDFQAWASSAAFGEGHKAHAKDGPVGTHAELWSFDVAQHERVASDASSDQ
jgi:heme-degrading monooxygenase HmoA